MRIGRIVLDHFGPYENADVAIDESMAIFVAQNASGKSKLAQAVQLSLAGRSDGTGHDGKGSRDKVMLGADKAVVTLGIGTAKGPIEIQTAMAATGGMIPKIIVGESDGSVSTKALSDGFKRWLDNLTERFSCILDPEYFVKQKADEQRDILAALVLPPQYEFDPKLKALADKHIAGIDWTKPPVQVIDYIFGDTKRGVYGLRRTAKATLDGIHIPEKPRQPTEDVANVQKKLSEVRLKQNQEARKVKQGGTVQVGRVEQSLEQAKANLAAAQADRKAAKDRMVLIEADLLDGPTLTTHKRMAAKRKDYDALTAEINGYDSEIEGQKQLQQVFEAMLEDEHGNPVDHAECPTCTQTITHEFIAGKVQEFHQLQLTAEDEKASCQGRQRDLGDIAASERALKDHEAKIAEKLEQVRKVTATEERITLCEAQIKDLEQALLDAKAKETAPIDTSTLDRLTREMSEWEAKLAPAVQYESTLTQIREAEARADAQKAIVQELETLVAEFGPKGIKAKLIDEHIGAFETTVNNVLKIWGYAAKLSIEPYSFEVMTPKLAPNYIPLKELSGFESLMFGVALQSAIAVFSKLKMILVDAADVMKGERLVNLFRCVRSMLKAGILEQAIILQAVEENAPPPKPKAGVGYYSISDGKIERVA